MSSSDHREVKGRNRPSDVRRQPGRGVGDVDSGNVTHGKHTVPLDNAVRDMNDKTVTLRRYRADMSIDVTDATFQTEVIDRSANTTVIVDLWAPWCGPCRTLGPILENAINATNGQVVLAKVNVDENPGVSQAFQVQSIPAVYALKEGQVVDGFVGAESEQKIQQFVAGLLPSVTESAVADLVRAGDEASLRSALELDPSNEDAIVALAEMLVTQGLADEALAFLARIPENERTRKVAASARLSEKPIDDYDAKLDSLLDRVKGDDEIRQEFVDILELMGADDPRTAVYRKKLTARLF